MATYKKISPAVPKENDQKSIVKALEDIKKALDEVYKELDRLEQEKQDA